MTTLSEAREAQRTLSDLQQKAAMLPQLEAQESRYRSQANLDALRLHTQRDIDGLYQKYQEAYTVYQEAFNEVLKAMGEAGKALKSLFDLKRQIKNKVQSYASAKVQHSLEFDNTVNLYRDGLQIEYEATNDLNVRPLDLALTPKSGSAVFDSLLRLLEYF